VQAPVNTDESNVAHVLMDGIFEYHQWIRLALLPLIAAGPALVLRKRTGYGYGEQIVVAAMMTTGSAILSLAFIGVEWYPEDVRGGMRRIGGDQQRSLGCQGRR